MLIFFFVKIMGDIGETERLRTEKEITAVSNFNTSRLVPRVLGSFKGFLSSLWL